jgi:4-alpha-glucanotransferase
MFAALSGEQSHRPWWEWPEPLRNRQPEALKEARARLEQPILFQTWLQWIAETQWREVRKSARQREILLCGDEPFIVGQDSADTWAHPDILRRDARLGVPPDAFSATGQDWGLPFFDSEVMRRDDYAWLRFRAKKAASYFDVRRVDHALGYFRQWIRDGSNTYGRFIPPDEPSQRSLGEKLFRLVSAEAAILAEDLGMVPSFVREILTQLGIPGYRVLRWERDDPGVYRNPHEFPKTSLVTTGTHDTETLREWWENLPQTERDAVANAYPELHGVAPTAEFTPMLHRALLSAAEAAASLICVVPWQDVLGTRDRINLPGTMTESNWSYRIEQPVEELKMREETRRAAEMMSWLADLGGR